MKKIFTSIVLFISFSYPASLAAQGIFQLYGTTTFGGPDDKGTLFSTRYDGTGHHIKKNFTVFNPGIVSERNKPVFYNNKFYCLLGEGGLNNDGLISEYDPASGTYIKRADLASIGASGSESGLVVYNNKLYGVTLYGGGNDGGVLFEFNPITGVLIKKHDFINATGSMPGGDLTPYNDRLYGITVTGGNFDHGVIFEFNPATGSYSVKAHLRNETTGAFTKGSLAVYNNKLWGMGSMGAVAPLFAGNIFSFDPATNLLEVKASATLLGGAGFYGTLAILNNKMYGVLSQGGTQAQGLLFQYDPATNVLTKEMDFSNTTANNRLSLIVYNNLLYGASIFGGVQDNGVIFSYNPVTNVYTTRIELSPSFGIQATGMLTLVNDKLYGFTGLKGTYGSGTLFEYTPASNDYQPKIHLGGGTLAPIGKMILHNNKLYGVARQQDDGNAGAIYEYDPVTTSFTLKKIINNTDGRFTDACTFTFLNNKFYGVATEGGINNAGVIFEYDPATNTYTKLYDFGGINGKHPGGALILYNSKLYGTCASGGINDRGTIFEYNPITNVFANKVLFDNASGTRPSSGLTLYNGKIYGVAAEGGTQDAGTLFEYLPLANGLTKLADFDLLATGKSPLGGLTGYNNKLYGLTSDGNDIQYIGKLYEYNIGTQTLTAKIDLDLEKGRHAISKMTLLNNKLYGMTNIGGAGNFGGVLFEYNPAFNTYNKKINFTGINGRLPRACELTAIPAPVAPGSANACANANFTMINAANANEWIAFTDAEGRAVAEINANGNILGNVQVRFYINNGSLRQMNGSYYADRNITITTQQTPVTPVSVRLYLKHAEFLTLRNTPGSGVTLPADISVFKNNDFCAADINSNATMLPTTHAAWGEDHVYTTEVSSFSSFYFTATSKVLPIHILSFTGKADAIANILNWKATCTGNSIFTVERSTDAVHFTAIGTINATAADCNMPFMFTDAAPPAGKAFYRLKMTEENASVKYSDIVLLNRSGNEILLVEILPNPVNGPKAILRVTTTKAQTLQLKMADASGRELINSKAVLQQGINMISLNTASLAAGIYYVQYRGEGQPNKTIKLLKQ